MTKHILSRKERAIEFESGFKTCPSCKLKKPVAEYNVHKKKLDGLQPFCRDCCRVKALVCKYGLTPESLNSLLEKQGRVCGMCSGHLNDWAVDHDHSCCPGYRSCGKCVRGVLCGPCNRALGHFEKVRDSATEYLRRCGE